MILELGISVAMLSTVAVEAIGRRNGDVVLAVCGINGSGGDGQLVLIVSVGRVVPVLVDVGSTDPFDGASWEALKSRLGVDLDAGTWRDSLAVVVVIIIII